MVSTIPSRSQLFSTDAKSYREVSIPVPWGKIAGKWWGPIETKPIICLHGLQDNCGSFDRLIPFLIDNGNISFLAIDFPGHGYSTPIPRGMFIEYFGYTLLIARICNYFNWNTVSLMGHSLGAMASFGYTILYPERVNFLICIDALKPPGQVPFTAKTVRINSDLFFKYEQISTSNEEPPSYTLEELIQKLTAGYRNSVTPESALYLLERNIASSKKFPGKYYFTRDPVLKVKLVFNWPQHQIVEDVKHITHPIFVCKATKGSYFEREENFYSVLNKLKTSSQDCDFHMVEGTHHLHLNEPEYVGIHIKNFLSKHYKPEVSNLNKNSLFCEAPHCPLNIQSQSKM